MPIQITPKQAPECLIDVLKAKKVPMMVSSPGIGKSSIAKQVAKTLNLFLIDVRLAQCDPTDLLGFPTINEKTGKAGYAAMDTFPLEGDTIPEGYSGWLILFDEFPSAPLSVQAAAYKIVLDKMVGQRKLHKNVAMMAAGNLATDKAIVNRISTALQSRMVHFELVVSHPDFIEWANQSGIDHRIISFLNFQPPLLHKFDPDHNDFTFACPRTWEFMSDIIKPWKEINATKLPTMAGTVSEGVAREFLGYSQIFESLPTIQDVMRSPEGFDLPTNEPSIMYAISGMISAWASVSNIPTLIRAVDRLPIEFQVICLTGALKRDPTLKEDSAVRTWISQNAQNLV